MIRKRYKSEVAIEIRCLFIGRFDYDGEHRERTGGPNHSTDRVGEQKIADPFATDSRIARETPNECGGDNVIARQTFYMFAWQVGDGEPKGTQAVEADDAELIIGGDENTRYIAFLVLAGAKPEPII